MHLLRFILIWMIVEKGLARGRDTLRVRYWQEWWGRVEVVVVVLVVDWNKGSRQRF